MGWGNQKIFYLLVTSGLVVAQILTDSTGAIPTNWLQEGRNSNQDRKRDAGTDKKITVSSVFVIDLDRNGKAIICYPASTECNFVKIIRLIDSLQLTATRPDVFTPVNRKPRDDLIVKPGATIEGLT